MTARALLLLSLAALLLPLAARAQETPGDFYDSAQTEYQEGRLHEAWTDFSIYANLDPHGDYADYAQLFIWLARVQLHQKAEADLTLAQARQELWNAQDGDWVSKIADFFLDQISETDLLAAADLPGDETVNQQHCEAWYYIGMKRLLNGDTPTAVHDFHKCLATDVKDFTEYDFAQAQLKALGEEPP